MVVMQTTEITDEGKGVVVLAMKAERRYTAASFLSCALGKYELHVKSFYSQEKSCGAHCTGG
jgi:hypothetical protein